MFRVCTSPTRCPTIPAMPIDMPGAGKNRRHSSPRRTSARNSGICTPPFPTLTARRRRPGRGRASAPPAGSRPRKRRDPSARECPLHPGKPPANGCVAIGLNAREPLPRRQPRALPIRRSHAEAHDVGGSAGKNQRGAEEEMGQGEARQEALAHHRRPVGQTLEHRLIGIACDAGHVTGVARGSFVQGVVWRRLVEAELRTALPSV